MTCPTVRMDAEMYETLGTSLRIASTSSSESFELEPRPARAPEDVIVPGMTMRKFVPRDFSRSSDWMRAPSPIPTTATTQATPMMMPSAVRSDRSLLRARAHDERGRNPDDVPVEAPLADQEAALLRLLEETDGLLGRGRDGRGAED